MTRYFVEEVYVCLDCSSQYIVWRLKENRRGKFHKKSLFCPECNGQQNCIKEEGGVYRMDNGLLGRSIKIETNIRCDYCGRQIEKGKYGTQIVGDPETIKAQGLYHGKLCYEGALADYNEKKKELDMEEESA